MKQTIQNIFIFAYFCLLMMLLGAVLFESFINYPNWFHNIPDSLVATSNFLQVRNPGHFFQVIFIPIVIAGIGFVISGWKIKPARTLILISLILLISIEALTTTYLYPRLDVLFREGTSVHTVEFLRQTAQEFLTVSWMRVASVVMVNVLAFVGLWKFIQHKANRSV